MFFIRVSTGFEVETVECLTAQKVYNYVSSALARHVEGDRTFHCTVTNNSGIVVGEVYYYAHGIIA